MDPRADILPWEASTRNWAIRWILTCRNVLRAPSSVFVGVGPGRLLPAIFYGMGVGIVIGIAAASFLRNEYELPLWKLAAAIVAFTVILPTEAALMGAVFHGVAWILGGRAAFVTAIRTALYASTATMMFVPTFLFGNTPAGSVAAVVATVACLLYGQRVSSAAATRWYGLRSSQSWTLWIATVIGTVIAIWIIKGSPEFLRAGETQ